MVGGMGVTGGGVRVLDGGGVVILGRYGAVVFDITGLRGGLTCVICGCVGGDTLEVGLLEPDSDTADGADIGLYEDVRYNALEGERNDEPDDRLLEADSLVDTVGDSILCLLLGLVERRRYGWARVTPGDNP